MTIDIARADWSATGPAAAIRREVFVEEQRVPPDLEWDGEDAGALHWLALIEGHPVGTLRLLRDGHVGRVAVRKAWRSQGVGTALMNAVIGHARAQPLHELYLHAQLDAQSFYERLGFVPEGPVFQEAGIPHRTLRQLLAPRQLGLHAGRFAARDRAAVALDLAQQTRRQLRLLSNELEPALFDNSEFAAALSRLARLHRHSEIRLLVTSSRAITQRGHQLLDLQRRLPSAIRLRRLSGAEVEITENFLVADASGLLCFNLREPERAWADYRNQPVAESYRNRFDEWWHRADDDPELRLLTL